ncbi:DUF7527 domain-containing protein [Haloarcula salina]|uniref:DUF7527 domain-containing protein n=1 Tax=Haloarcula salina TaxID=1429914 RepID=A0AA41KFF2_9EURY|nr:hypothetical protein [Haloarcula salina]MBV0901992.1 hypothetical protein [Haloarcula salina]
MSTRTVERIDGWESVPFEGGYAGLQALAGEEFSGAVTAGPTRLFMLNGTVVGVLDGDIEDFEAAEGTARRAPHDALALLAVMQERADEVKAKYYTEETPLSEVDRTLSDGSFTGFIELSENVLSGDYYTVYHQGRSMSVAWVGNAEKLLTGDEAFETADDEVGIYEVMPVDIDPVEIPEPVDDDPTDAAAAVPDSDEGGASDDADDADAADAAAVPTDDAADATDTDESPNDSRSSSAIEPTEPPADSGRTDRQPSEGGPTGGAGGPPGTKGTNPGGARQRSADDRADPAADRTADATGQSSTTEEPNSDVSEDTESATTPETDSAHEGPVAGDQSSAREQTDATSTREPAQAAETRTEDSAQASEASRRTPETNTERAGPTEQHREPRRPRAQAETAAAEPEPSSADLETRSIPSLDPGKSASAREQSGGGTQVPPSAMGPASASRRDQSAGDADANTPQSSGAGRSQDRSPHRETPTSAERRTSEPATVERDHQRQEATGQEPPTQPAPDRDESSSGSDERVAELETELEARAETVSELESELADLEATTEELRTERDRLESELADARAEIERLEDRLAEQAGDGAPAGPRLSTAEAINGTNLFVRYHSKGKATLEKARDGEATREQVEENLRLEHHTQFEAEGATVDGTPFEEFLSESIQYRFVNWLVRNLLYEIASTGHTGSMKDLYEGLPQIDRAELNGQVSVTYTEDGQETRSQERFDVVVRDRMGNPLVVANINDSRDPATDSQMTDLVTNAERVGNASDSLAAAFLVTSSFFEPGALETATEATSSGLFSRDKRKSFVNLSRKEGFHLCLLEARNQEFHLAVPEL